MLADIAERAAFEPSRWPTIVVLLAGLLALGGGAYWLYRRAQRRARAVKSG